MHINEATYNWEELQGEDKAFIQGYNEGCDRLIKGLETWLDDATDGMIKPFADIYKEVGLEIAGYLTTLTGIDRIELTASMMDANPGMYSE